MSRKLLLADDSITVQRVIELTFSDEGLEIATVGDGTAAIDRLARDRPDIVLADLNMPGADGYAVAEYVKRGSDLAAHTRVVLLTGTFEPVDALRAKGLGIDGVLEKPFQPKLAIELVRRLLEQPPLAPPRVDRPAAAGGWTDDVDGPTGAPLTESAAFASLIAEAEAKDAGPERAHDMAAGYPFEPGATATRSTPAELDDYFTRLDEALANAGLKASPAVRDMLAESRESMSVASITPADGAAPPEPPPRPLPDAGGTAGPNAPGSAATSPAAARPVTLVDAFSALLAAEQGETAPAASAAAAFTPAPAAAGPADPAGAIPADPIPADPVPANAVTPAVAGSTAGAPSAPTLAGVAPTAPVPPALTAAGIPDDLIDAIARRVVAQIGDRLVRDVVTSQVVDVAERLVREEIERLKAAAESPDQGEAGQPRQG